MSSPLGAQAEGSSSGCSREELCFSVFLFLPSSFPPTGDHREINYRSAGGQHCRDGGSLNSNRQRHTLDDVPNCRCGCHVMQQKGLEITLSDAFVGPRRRPNRCRWIHSSRHSHVALFALGNTHNVLGTDTWWDWGKASWAVHTRFEWKSGNTLTAL